MVPDLRSLFAGRCTILQASIDPTSLARTVYVSFAPELDKRLDEWIDESRLLGPAPAWETSIASTAERATAAKTVEPVGVDGVATSASSEQQQKQAAVATEGTPAKPDSVLKTKTQLRHEKERRSLESELTGSRKRKLPGDVSSVTRLDSGMSCVSHLLSHEVLIPDTSEIQPLTRPPNNLSLSPQSPTPKPSTSFSRASRTLPPFGTDLTKSNRGTTHLIPWRRRTTNSISSSKGGSPRQAGAV